MVLGNDGQCGQELGVPEYAKTATSETESQRGCAQLESRPAETLKLALGLPIHLYRYNLGRLLGYRFLLLTHRGRKTGILHQTVLEVILYDQPRKRSGLRVG
jgi:hypothetical protein